MLYSTVDELSEQERQQLLQYLMTGQKVTEPARKTFKFNLFPGMFETDDTFDDPLPDSFWLGDE